MANIYTVYIDVDGEPTEAKLEFVENAKKLARDLDALGYDVTILDEAASAQEGCYVSVDYSSTEDWEDGEDPSELLQRREERLQERLQEEGYVKLENFDS